MHQFDAENSRQARDLRTAWKRRLEALVQRRRPTAITTSIAGVLLLPILSGCAGSTDAAVAAPEAVCQPAGDIRHLDIEGPGQPNPERAVLRVLRGKVAVAATTIDGTQATAVVNSDTSGLVQVQLHRAKDGWWPDSFRSCATESDS